MLLTDPISLETFSLVPAAGCAPPIPTALLYLLLQGCAGLSYLKGKHKLLLLPLHGTQSDHGAVVRTM